MAPTFRKILAWSLIVSTASVGFVVACGIDVVGTSSDGTPPTGLGEDGSNAVPSDGSVGPVTDADAGALDAEPDAETCPWPSLQRHAPWPMIGGCVGHPGRTVHRGPKKQPKIVWTVTVTTRESQPVVGADGTVYLPADVSGVVAFAPDGGRRPFTDSGTGVANNVTNVPSIGVDGTLYFGAENDVVAAGVDGISWRFVTSGEIDTSTLVDEDGTVYSGSFNDTFYAISPDGGKRWQRNLNGDIWASAALGKGGAIYVGATNKLSALARDGGRSWIFSTNGNIQSSPVVADDGTIYIGTTGRRLHAINVDGGAKWTFIAKGNFGWQQLSALGKDGTIYAPAGGYLTALDPLDGGTKWERAIGANLRTSAVVDADGNIYVGADNRLLAFDANGNELWHLDINGNPSGFAIGRDGTIYVACDNDTLVALHE
jgi:sugar lactone lactonase YvrE